MSYHKNDSPDQKARTLPGDDAKHRSRSLFLSYSLLGAIINPHGPVPPNCKILISTKTTCSFQYRTRVGLPKTKISPQLLDLLLLNLLQTFMVARG